MVRLDRLIAQCLVRRLRCFGLPLVARRRIRRVGRLRRGRDETNIVLVRGALVVRLRDRRVRVGLDRTHLPMRGRNHWRRRRRRAGVQRGFVALLRGEGNLLHCLNTHLQADVARSDVRAVVARFVLAMVMMVMMPVTVVRRRTGGQRRWRRVVQEHLPRGLDVLRGRYGQKGLKGAIAFFDEQRRAGRRATAWPLIVRCGVRVGRVM